MINSDTRSTWIPRSRVRALATGCLPLRFLDAGCLSFDVRLVNAMRPVISQYARLRRSAASSLCES